MVVCAVTALYQSPQAPVTALVIPSVKQTFVFLKNPEGLRDLKVYSASPSLQCRSWTGFLLVITSSNHRDKHRIIDCKP